MPTVIFLMTIPNKRVFYSFLLVFSVFGSSIVGQIVDNSLNERQKAERIWELAIKAKAGRERLYKIESILIISRSTSKTSRGEKYYPVRTNLILRDKFWSFEDAGDTVFGITQMMMNYENRITYFGTHAPENTKVTPLEVSSNYKGYQNAIILYLMESSWLKPVLKKVMDGQINKDKVYTIETEVDGRRVDFAIDRHTYLPVRISLYDVGIDGQTRIVSNDLANYVEVDGIKVPQIMSCTGCGTARETIRFNVDYDPEIFLRPPTKVTADAWKRK